MRTLALLFLLISTNVFAFQPVTEPFQIAKTIGCTACHEIDRKVVGPAWMDVSKRYANEDPITIREFLRNKISNGGKGNWSEVTGGMFMPPYGSRIDSAIQSHRVPDNSLDLLIDFILGLHKSK